MYIPNGNGEWEKTDYGKEEGLLLLKRKLSWFILINSDNDKGFLTLEHSL